MWNEYETALIILLHGPARAVNERFDSRTVRAHKSTHDFFDLFYDYWATVAGAGVWSEIGLLYC